MTAASAPPAAPVPPPRPARTGLALGLAGAGIALVVLLAWLAYRTPAARVDPVHAIAAKLVQELGRELPKDYGDGLVLERITVEGRTVVMLMRSQGMTLAAAAAEPERFATVRQEEQARLLAFCSNPEFRLVLEEGVVITRRFLDRDDRRFFDVSLAAADCREIDNLVRPVETRE